MAPTRIIGTFVGEQAHPRFAPDGRRIAFSGKEPGKPWGIYLMDVAGETSTRVAAAGDGAQGPAWSPDGTALAYVRDGAIWTVRLSDGATTKLTGDTRYNAGTLTTPDWSPNGQEIVFAAADSGVEPDLWVVSATGSIRRRLRHAGGEWFPRWSPDGRHIVFYSTWNGRMTDVWLIPAAGGPPLQLTDDAGEDFRPAFSPDGQWVVFTSRRGGKNDLWMVPSRGGTAHQLTDDDALELAPDWALDGRLVFLYDTSRAQLMAVDVEGGRPRTLTLGARDKIGPAVSPDGSRIAFESDLFSRERSVVVSSIDGGAPANVFSGDAGRSQVAWSGDGNALAFVENPGGWAPTRDLWVAAADGSERRQLTTIGDVRGPVWIDGDGAIAFTSGGRPYIVAPSGGPLRALPAPDGNVVISDYLPATRELVAYVDGSPFAIPLDSTATPRPLPAFLRGTDGARYSRDASRVAYLADSAGMRDLFVATSDGNRTVRLTRGPPLESWPSWTPDGRTIVYSVRSGGARLGVIDLSTRGGPKPADTVRPSSRRNGRELTVRQASAPPDIDGSLADSAWRDAAVVELPYEFSPGNNVPAPVRTSCRMAYDTEHLYVACEANDPEPDRIRAFLTPRDNLVGQDLITLSLDTFGSARRSYEFQLSPLGVQADAIYDQHTAVTDYSWDAIWKSAGRLTPHGYVVEAAIPFKSLRFPRQAGEQRWAFQIQRAWPRSRATQLRSALVDPGMGCVLCQLDRLVGLAGVRPGHNVELTPTVTTARVERRTNGPGSAFSDSLRAEAGVDLRWSMTPDVTLNATVNPDFSQVEADALQLVANAKFTPSSPERRPFFVEGSDLFSTLIPVVFTRAIVDPVAGGKLTGTLGRTVGGVLVARDEVTNLLIPSNQGSALTSIPGGATVGVARLRQDIGTGVTLGALLTSREGRGYANRVGSLDAFVRPRSGLSVRAQAVVTRTRYPDSLSAAGDRAGRTFDGSTLRALARYETRGWTASTQYSIRSAGYRADVGFEPQVDIRYVDAWVSPTLWGRPGGWFTRITPLLGVVREDDYHGRPLDRWRFLGVTYEGPRQTRLSVTARAQDETYRGVTHDVGAVRTTLTLNPSRLLSAEVRNVFGHAVDYDNNRRARTFELAPTISLRPGTHLDVTVTQSRQRLTIPAGTVLDDDVTRVRAAYTFTARSFFRAVIQRHRTGRDPTLHGRPVSRRSTTLASQLLYAYRVNPQTALHVGYGDDWLDGIDPERGRTELAQNSRTFFFKLGYAWRP